MLQPTRPRWLGGRIFYSETKDSTVNIFDKSPSSLGSHFLRSIRTLLKYFITGWG